MKLTKGSCIKIEVSVVEAKVIEHALYFSSHIQDHRKSTTWEPLRVAMAEKLKRLLLNGIDDSSHENGVNLAINETAGGNPEAIAKSLVEQFR